MKKIWLLSIIFSSLSGCTALLLGNPSGRTSRYINPSQLAVIAALPFPQAPTGQKVYDASECVGAVVMVRYHGTVIPKSAYHPTCYGAWFNGQCIGPMLQERPNV